MPVLFAMHKGTRAGQGGHDRHQVGIVRQIHHRPKDRRDTFGAHLARQRAHVERRGEFAALAHPFLEPREEVMRRGRRIVDDLARQKAVFRRHIALDVKEAQHFVRRGPGQQQRGEAPHGVAGEVKLIHAKRGAGRECHVNQQRN